MARTCIDHIVVTARSLESGAAHVRDALGVSLQAGGEHPRMATHNLLLRLGDDRFLEVIAPNPAVAAPTRPRWFALDTLGPDAAPSLSMWVVRTSDVRGVARASAEPLGPIEPMHRGTLDWHITIPADGSVPLDGVAPALIEWGTPVHPAARLEDRGVALETLEIVHPDPDRVSRLLQSLAFDGPVQVRRAEAGVPPHLVAHLDTPLGRRRLSCRDRP
ncbi:MAG: VOC family protein [Burkholderiales bacterium]